MSTARRRKPTVGFEYCDPMEAYSRIPYRAPVEQGGAGLTALDVSRLTEAGYGTVEAVAFTPLRVLVQAVKGISDIKGVS